MQHDAESISGATRFGRWRESSYRSLEGILLSLVGGRASSTPLTAENGLDGNHKGTGQVNSGMGTGLAIRRYQPDDRDRVEAVTEAALRDTGAYFEDPPDAANTIEDEYLASGGEFLVGEVNDRIVATGAFRPVRGVVTNHLSSFGDDTVEIKRMHVAPPHQRQGYGRQIFDELQQRALNQGYTELVLITTGPQTAAQHFYDANGFIEIERESVDFRGETFDAIVYRKALTESTR